MNEMGVQSCGPSHSRRSVASLASINHSRIPFKLATIDLRLVEAVEVTWLL